MRPVTERARPDLIDRSGVAELHDSVKQRLRRGWVLPTQLLLGDPEVVLLDEAVNGLDADGVRWVRELLRSMAAQGRTILLSSHLMSEMELTADRLVVIGRGRLLADTSVRELADRFGNGVLVRSPRAAELAGVLTAAGAAVASDPGGGLSARRLDPTEIGDLAARHGLPVTR
jgi:ABC-2 type transport system ATP-binding protein